MTDDHSPPEHCVEIFLPLRTGGGEKVPGEVFRRLEEALTERFGGVTAFTRAPARGRWSDGKDVVDDDVVILEVIAPDLDRQWWGALKERLEAEFEQEEVLIRSHRIERL